MSWRISIASHWLWALTSAREDIVVQFGLDFPVIADVTQKGLRIRAVGRTARHTIRHVDRPDPRHGPLVGDLVTLVAASPLVTQGQ